MANNNETVDELIEMGFQLDKDGKPVENNGGLEKDQPAPDADPKEDPEGKKDNPDDDPKEDPKDEPKDDDPKDEPDPDDKKKDDEPKDDPDPDDDTEQYNAVLDEYEIETAEDLKEILASSQQMAEQLEEANKKIKELEEKPPTFKSERQEKIFKFMSEYDLESMGEGLTAYAKLVSLPIDNISEREALKERYILENLDVSREDAIALFEDEYEEKYKIDKDNFDSDEEYKKRKNILDIKFKKDAEKAKSFLKEESKKYKAESGQQKPVEKEESVNHEVIEASRTKYKNEFAKAMDGFESLIFSPEGKKEGEFTYKFKPDQLKRIEASVSAYLDQDGIYTKKGELTIPFNPETQKQNFAIALFGREMIAEAIKHGITLGSIEDIKKKSEEKPDRKSSGASATKVATFDDQFEVLAEQKKRERGE